MGDDIFFSWKKYRFVVAEPGTYDGPGHLIILADFVYWTHQVEHLIQWCIDNGCEQKGMTVRIPTDELLTMFTLRWDGPTD